jgi:hypothetical protein
VRRIRTILAFAPVVASAVFWVVSYPWFLTVHYSEAGGVRDWYLMSDGGGLYAATGWASGSRVAGWSGAVFRNQDISPSSIERGFGATPERWKPVRVIGDFGNFPVVLVIVPWWFVTVVFAAPAAWYWRRNRREGGRNAGQGFAVAPAGGSRP